MKVTDANRVVDIADFKIKIFAYEREVERVEVELLDAKIGCI